MEEGSRADEVRKKPILVNGEAVPEWMIEEETTLLRQRYAEEIGWEEVEGRAERIDSDARENAVERFLLIREARATLPAPENEEVENRYRALINQHGGEEAFKAAYELTPEVERSVRVDLADRILLERLFDSICAEVERPNEETLRAWYDAHRDEFFEPEAVHAGHIVMHPEPDASPESTYAEMLNVLERLKGGEPFEEVAAQRSHCAPDEYDLGWFPRGRMVEAFEEVAFATPAGGLSDVFQTEFGHHVLKVFERRTERTRPFEEVRYEIEVRLFDERKNEAIGAVADRLRAAAKVENLTIFEEAS